MNDLTLVQLPQWSPYKPALSLPSLAAWLRRAGYRVRCVDANLLFYEYLFSAECAEILLQTLEESDLPLKRKRALKGIFLSQKVFQDEIYALRPPEQGRLEKGRDLEILYRGNLAFTLYTKAISLALNDIEISTHDFNIALRKNTNENLEDFAENPPKVIEVFIDWVMTHHILSEPTKVIGLSCIGQSQLPFTLLFGKWIKERLPTPILVGGTIFSRIFERGRLKPDWFGKYIDIVVRNEGEKPCEKILENISKGQDLAKDVPGIVYCRDHMLFSQDPACPLSPEELPIPDFDGLPLDRYLSPELTLPVLASRGCYWGKCEFCHHGMVYGDKYTAYPKDSIYETMKTLSEKYNVKSFFFNDEAIPPKILRTMARDFPDHEESGWVFQALIKFEKIYKDDMWQGLHRVGCRRLLVGLESASERVLKLMKKPNTYETIYSNVKGAHDAGIHLHCFLFFGFPGETEADAQITYDFIMNNSHIVGNFGACSFAFEHNAPIYHHPEAFGLELIERGENDTSVYYDFKCNNGISRKTAVQWSKKLHKDALGIPKYRSIQWIANEHYLSLLAERTSDELDDECIAFQERGRAVSKELAERQWQYLNAEEIIAALF